MGPASIPQAVSPLAILPNTHEPLPCIANLEPCLWGFNPVDAQDIGRFLDLMMSRCRRSAAIRGLLDVKDTSPLGGSEMLLVSLASTALALSRLGVTCRMHECKGQIIYERLV